MVMSKVRQSEKISGGWKNVAIPESVHRRLVEIADARGMLIKSLITRWVEWLDDLDPSEIAIVMRQIHRDDAAAIADLVLKRKAAAEMRDVARNAGLHGIDSRGALPVAGTERKTSGGHR